jgi:hypothetical protein
VGHEHPADERAWVRVDCGAYTALLCCMVVDGKDGPYLDIDVHPFVDGDHATAGVFGMSEGFRANLNTSTWPTRTTSQGWDSANLLAILVGAQASHEGGVK